MSIPCCTSIERDDDYDGDDEDSGSVYTPLLGDGYKLESDDGYDADDEVSRSTYTTRGLNDEDDGYDADTEN